MNRHEDEYSRLFDMTVERYGPMIWRVCRSYATPRASSDDMFQEVMASLWVGFKTFRGQAALSTWVYRVTINTCISFLRRNDSRILYSDFSDSVEIADEQTGYSNDDFSYLQYLISTLGAVDKAILLLWLEERSYSEIADITGLSANVIGTRLSRIRARLHEIWQKESENL